MHQIKMLEGELHKRDCLLQGIADATNRLITSMDRVIAVNEALAILGHATGVDRVYIFELHPHPESGELAASQRFEWARETVEPQIDNPYLQNSLIAESGMARLFDKLAAGNSIGGPVREFPETEREVLEQQGIISVLNVPIFIGDKFWGFVGFDDCHSERRWSQNERSALTAVAASIGGAIERKRAEEALAAEKERLSITLRSIAAGVMATDEQNRVTLLNKAAEKIIGWTHDEAVGRPLSEIFRLIHEKTREPRHGLVEQALKTGKVVDLSHHTALIAKDGAERIAAVGGAPLRDKNSHTIGAVLVFEDVTEKRRIEEELAKVKKLESISILAGGIAHDFNNILTGIMGNISLAKMLLKPEEEIHEILSEGEEACRRAKDLTQQLLTFAKGGAPVKKAAAMAEILKDSANFILRGSNVRCEFRIPGDLRPVEVDHGQINQVVQNLIINAEQAMPGGGIITVLAENIDADDKSFLPLPSGRYVKISIRDRGVGIPREHLQKIFDPYFTTKQKGSGLGLAIAYSIVKKHGGHLDVESDLGVGTTFHIFLPAAQGEVPVQPPGEIRHPLGEGKILLMDDEEVVRDVACRALKHLGYEVKLAKEGAEAIAFYKDAMQAGRPFDAVIIDLTIPGGIGGKEVIQKLREIDPKVKAIVSSGYSSDPIMSSFREHGFKGVVVKPYEIAELSQAVHAVIKENSAPFSKSS